MELPRLEARTFHVTFILLFFTSLVVVMVQYRETGNVILDHLKRWESRSEFNRSAVNAVTSFERDRISTTSSESDSRKTEERATNNRPPLIAHWQHPAGRNGYGPRQGEHCGCKFTYDRSLLMQSDAVALYCRDADKSNLPPDFPNRTQTQKYVWWCLEPPTHVKQWGIDLGYRPGFFNWTMTPRRDSSIRITWGLLEDMKSALKEENLTLDYIMSLKNKTAVAIVSSCGSVKNTGAKARLRLMHEMKQKGFDLDTFGKCFNNILDRSQPITDLRNYKFHLSFENSYHCRDYISEKFWKKGIGAGVVPVVWGARKEDYLAIAPESSFIFVEDFKSVEDLVKYLNYLDKNDTAYMKYLEWRSPENLKHFFHEPRVPPIGSEFVSGCELCRQLLKRRDSSDESVSVIPSVKDFYYDPNDKDCFRGARQNETYWKFGSES